MSREVEVGGSRGGVQGQPGLYETLSISTIVTTTTTTNTINVFLNSQKLFESMLHAVLLAKK